MGIKKERIGRSVGASSDEFIRGFKDEVRVGSRTSEEFWVRVGVHQGSVLSPLIFAIVVNVVTKHAREGLVNEILCADDLVLMSESLDDFRERFQDGEVRWKTRD